MFDLQAGIRNWREDLHRAGLHDTKTLDELESHLRAYVDDSIAAGTPPEAALKQAIEAIGGPQALKTEFYKTAEFRWPLVSAVLLVLVLTAAYFAFGLLMGRAFQKELWRGLRITIDGLVIVLAIILFLSRKELSPRKRFAVSELVVVWYFILIVAITWFHVYRTGWLAWTGGFGLLAAVVLFAVWRIQKLLLPEAKGGNLARYYVAHCRSCGLTVPGESILEMRGGAFIGYSRSAFCPKCNAMRLFRFERRAMA